MKHLLLLLMFLPPVTHAAKEVHHPAPKEPLYLEAKWYEELKKHVKAPPSLKSAEQKADEDALNKAQKKRTTGDCDRANTEIFVSLDNFFGTPRGPVDSDSVKRLTPFFEQLRNDGDYFVQLLKKEFPRDRPFKYVAGIKPCVPIEVTGAYPSGHAVLSRLYSQVLSDFFPEHRKALEQRAEVISNDRVVSGMHHPTDIEAGKKVGDLVYQKLLTSPRFKADFQAQLQKR